MKEPIKVLHVLSKMSFGGVQSVVMNYYRHIDSSKIQFDFVVQSSENFFYDEEIKRLGGKIYQVAPIHSNRKQFERDFFRVLIENPEYKIVHCHQNFLNIVPLRIAKKAGVPIRISHSHSNYKASSFIKEMQRKVFRTIIAYYATDYFACSRVAAQWLYGHHSKSSKCKIINNAIETKKYFFDPGIRFKKRKELGIDKELVLIHVGMFTDSKNHEYLFKVFEKVHNKNINTLLLLVGDGENRSKLMKAAKECSGSNNIIFLGKRDNVHEYLMAADYFVFPSKYEGLGMSVIEAQMSGLPCIVSDVVPREVDLFGDVSFISINETPETWANVIIQNNTSRILHSIESIMNTNYEIEIEAKKLSDYYLSTII